MNAPFSPRRRPLWLALALLVLACAAWLGTGRTARSAKPAETTPPPVQATTTQVRQQDVPIIRTGVGTVTPLATVTVRSRIDGQLERVGFVEGQDVKAGQLLAQLDARALQVQLEQAQAQKAKDAALLGNARIDLRRYETLIAQDAATRQQLDTQRALVAQLEAALKMDQAQIDAAQVQLSYATITAPIGGRTGARLVDPGNIVHATDPGGLVVINQIDPIAVVFSLPEGAFQDVNRALQGSQAPLAVQVSLPGSAQALASGRLTLLNNQIDNTTGTIRLKAQFGNPQHALWPGQYVDARLVLGVRRGALTVPAAAVQRGPEGTYVYTVGADGSAQIAPVEVAQIQDGLAVIDQGLAAGQRVVVDGQYKLRPGLKVAEAPRAAASEGGR
ncbi:MAG: efflux RND transporter periplasmic adaptor subunit [Burkholderiales bacterium]|uniref:Efflux RND transporter periplasmic adaptor subunit n=2 Tax=Ottowia TaxID=219181 RepID=A0ABV6PU83_9BURK|nr:efflux RND transporter periplasmic adaptor subunit [Burkholderiales bacterium]MBS0401482.1 efflux RND transporter periplasmic adaptor subunit [Pseudomonadota bacterium]MBS0413934.1 efflux RND transporter periplasmic adaptor subunit [Pseudomonadota bacterium]HMN56648.1 efflux RND transporter periplasmic adaptor subunit [Ottowia sp.]